MHPVLFRIGPVALYSYGLAIAIGFLLAASLAALDLFMPPLALAHAVGRIGCFLNGCCYGKPTALPWGVLFPPDILYRHPTQLYEAAALAVIFLLLKRIERRSPPAGTVLLAYGLLYGAWRFLVEFLRADNPPVLAGLTLFQLASLPLALLCGCLLLLRSRRLRQR